MEYRCKSIPITKLPVGARGLGRPLCDLCATRDCTNPIQQRRVAIFGVTVNMRVIDRGMDPGMVIECEGFTQ